MPEMNPYQKWVFVPTLEFWYQALLRYFHQPDPPRRQVPFVTQSLHDNDGLPQTGRWVCTGRPPARVPPLLRVSYWIGSSLLVPGTHEYRADFRSLSLAVLKLIIAWPLLFLLVLWSENLGLFRHSANTKLDSVQSLYGSSFRIDKENKHHPNYLKSDASPPSQSSSLDSPSDDDISVIMTTSGTHGNGIGPMDALPDSQSAWTEVAPHINTLSINIGGGRSRDNDDLVSVRPRYLCIVKDFKRMHYATIKVSDYLDHYGDHIDLDFIFVSYTRMQFRVATEEEIDNYPYESEATRDANREVAQADRVTLIKWGMEAAQRANISAFWIDFECIRNDDGSARSTSSSGDVYHICDIVRAAHSMIIAIGPAASDKVAAILEGRSPPAYSQDRITPWLRQWGSRLWTLPEALLCPSEHRIQLYALGDRSESNLMIAKRNFAERAWDDAAVVNELVHHFEGTATLTPHHFIEVALECFSRRQTDHFSQGDVAYATMGLFPIRQRPLVDKHDTGFQAFAKLCLCNNNSDFLGCLICLAPQPGEQWFRIGDRWSTKLSEIRPLITIRKVGTGNTIILDNANGFPIHWDGLHPEPYFEENDGSGSAYFFNIALMWCCSAPFSAFFSRSILSNFAGFLPITAIFALVAPVMLLRTRTRIRVPATPRLIGIEGFVDLSTLEKHLWGLNHGNLTDSTPLSYQDIGMGQMQSISDEELHSFTLLDTHLMTVTRFRSSVPPVAMFVVGEEGEKHRTLLCSYDHITQTFHREEVLRCDRRELKKESKLSGVRLSLASQPRRTDVLHSNVRFNRISWWAMEVMFLGICLTGFSLFDLIEYPQWKSNPQPTTSSYRMAMIIGQIPAWMIVSYTARPLETLPYILTSKFILNVLANATEDPKYFAFHGLLDSSLALLLIMAILSWYTLEEVIIRFLLWAILCPRLTLMVVPMEIASRFLGVESMLLSVNTLACVLCVCDRRTKGFSGIFGRPMDVSWLPMDQKSVISSRAAMGKFALGTNTRSLAKVPLSTILSRGALVFAAALLSKSYTGVWSRTDRDYVIDNAVFVLIASALGFVMYRVPSVSYYIMVSCSILSGCIILLPNVNSTPTSHYLLFQVVMSLAEIVQPIIWTIAVHEASTWSEAAGMICVAGAGSAVGQLTFETDLQGTINFLLIPAQMSIWYLLWIVYGRMGAACVKGGLRSLWRTTKTPQHDDPVSRGQTTCGAV